MSKSNTPAPRSRFAFLCWAWEYLEEFERIHPLTVPSEILRESLPPTFHFGLARHAQSRAWFVDSMREEEEQILLEAGLPQASLIERQWSALIDRNIKLRIGLMLTDDMQRLEDRPLPAVEAEFHRPRRDTIVNVIAGAHLALQRTQMRTAIWLNDGNPGKDDKLGLTGFEVRNALNSFLRAHCYDLRKERLLALWLRLRALNKVYAEIRTLSTYQHPVSYIAQAWGSDGTLYERYSAHLPHRFPQSKILHAQQEFCRLVSGAAKSELNKRSRKGAA